MNLAGADGMRKEYRFHVTAMLIGFTALILFQLYVQTERVLQMPYSMPAGGGKPAR